MQDRLRGITAIERSPLGDRERRQHERRELDRGRLAELASLRNVHDVLDRMDLRLDKLETRVNLLFLALGGLITAAQIIIPLVK